MTIRRIIQTLAFSLLALLVVACTPAAAPAEAEISGIGEDEETTSYVPVIREAKERYKIGYGNGLAADPFSVSVTGNLYDVAEQMGVDVVECDNGYDQELTFNCVDLLISQEVDGLIVANWLGDITDAVGQKWIDAGIPAVTYDTAHPGAVDFGADNYGSGIVAGEYLGNYILEKGWNPDDVWMIGGIDADLGEGPNQRIYACRDGLMNTVEIPEEQFVEVNYPYDTAEAYSITTDWLTAHPDAKHVIGCSIDDPRVTGMSGALEADGRVGTSAMVGQGVSIEALNELYRPVEDTTFIASVAYTPELYGTYMVPIIVDLIEGNPVPDRVPLDHFAIDHSNVADYYEADGTVAN